MTDSEILHHAHQKFTKQRHSAMKTAAILQLLQPLQMNNNDHRH
jgi:hypothetical protein